MSIMVEIKNEWIYASAFPYAFMVCSGTNLYRQGGIQRRVGVNMLGLAANNRSIV